METTSGTLREKIILSADDFGKTEEGNIRILKLAQKGKLNRVAIMVNRDHLSAKDLAHIGACSVAIDLHLEFPFQKNSFYNDITKNEIAKNHNIPLFRIRENENPEKILEYINSIKIC